MRRTFLIVALLFVYALAKQDQEKQRLRNPLMDKLYRMKKTNPEKFDKFKNFYTNELNEEEMIKHRYEIIAKKVNKFKTTWEATTYERDYTPLLGTIPEEGASLPKMTTTLSQNFKLPDNFDLRQKYPRCQSLKEVRDQANCGSCWAFAAVEAMSDRICIKSGQTLQTRVSAQNLLSCCSNCGNGCKGGYANSAWLYWKETGISTGGLYGDKTHCQPYFLRACGLSCPAYKSATPSCKRNCDDGNRKAYSTQMTYGANAYYVSGETGIMQELYLNGPVEANFIVYEDFYTYRSGIYHHVTGADVDYHSIKIIGWGIQNGVKYWLCVNSWNTAWGERGFFKIRRGSNECNIESMAYAGMPK